MSIRNPFSAAKPVRPGDALPHGPWAMEAGHLEALANRPTAGLFDDLAAATEPKPYELRDGVAVLSLTGPLMKQASMWTWLFGGTGTARFKEHVRAAVNDPAVSGILLSIDSPGGTIDGTAELGDEIAAAAKVKPVHAYVDGAAQSAAYWIASQAGRITAPRTAMVGSIGTYGVLVDSSQAAEQIGVKVHVIKAGEYKGAGVPGAPISQGALDATQRLIDALNVHFLAAVAKGRHMSADRVAGLATGETWTGDAAKSMGLIDAVGSMDDAMAALKAAGRTPSPLAASAQANATAAALQAAAEAREAAECERLRMKVRVMAGGRPDGHEAPEQKEHTAPIAPALTGEDLELHHLREKVRARTGARP